MSPDFDTTPALSPPPSHKTPYIASRRKVSAVKEAICLMNPIGLAHARAEK